MNSKKIWFLSLVLGLVAAGLMYAVVTGGTEKPAQPATTQAADDDKKEKKKEKEKEDPKKASAAENEKSPEEQTNEILPIKEGNRAMTMQVTDVTGVSGQVKPGSHVDVVAVMTVPKEYKDTQHDSATLLLENVKVLGVGHAADDPETKKKYQMVTVEVTPKQGLALGFATRYELYLMLRKDGDNKLAPKDTHIHEDDLHEGVFK